MLQKGSHDECPHHGIGERDRCRFESCRGDVLLKKGGGASVEAIRIIINQKLAEKRFKGR